MSSIGKPLSHNTRDNEQNKFDEVNGEVVVKTRLLQSNDDVINVNFENTQESFFIYNETNSITGGSSVDIVSYTVPVGKILTLSTIHYSGENIAVYTMTIDNQTVIKKRTYFNNYNGKFDISATCTEGQVVKIQVQNFRNSISDFNATLQGNIKDA